MILACTVWGLSAIYYKLLEHVPPLEVLSHRVLWSVLIFSLYQLFRGRLGAVLDLIRSRRDLKRVALASFMVSANWFLFIWAVQAGRVVETSLGYFIQPLVAVIFGIWLFSERLTKAQWVAVGLALSAVLLLSFGLGIIPWLSLILAITFAIYSAVKKRLTSGAISSVTAEATLLAPIAIIWLVGAHFFAWGGSGGIFGTSGRDSFLLALSGVLTAGPLMLMSYAAQRLQLATVGVLQYVNPSLQFFCAVVVFSEPFGMVHAVSFGLIWTALAIYSVSEFRR